MGGGLDRGRQRRARVLCEPDSTPAGGTHESGLREGLFARSRASPSCTACCPGCQAAARGRVRARQLRAVGQVLDPQFQGQIKERLNSRDAVRLVGGFSKSALDLWLHSNVEYGKKLAELAIRQAQARQRSAQKVEKRKSSGVAVLPGKLTDCEASDAARTEVFLVEGDSAGGSARWGATRNSRPSCARRCSIPGKWTAIACSPTTKSMTSRWPSASTRTGRTTRPTCPGCATAASASCRTRTSTARTSRCCC